MAGDSLDVGSEEGRSGVVGVEIGRVRREEDDPHLSTANLDTTLVIVAYGVTHLDLEWVPRDCHVIVVHNDRRLASVPRADNVYADANDGFGAGVNRALASVSTRRIAIVNPDAHFVPAHWDALATATPNEVVVLPFVDSRGVRTYDIRPNYKPLTLLLTVLRVGRLFRRGSRWRGQPVSAGLFSLRTHWFSGAAFSIDTDRMRAVGGFDPGYFLYFEDADLSLRLGCRFRSMVVRRADTVPATHEVGGCAVTSGDRRRVRRARRHSAFRLARVMWGRP